ncbi:UNVERIFIED_CONTAM: L-gulonolactone oxidase 3 [Sesamum angustifolium]|uniref:L-gulonolactone oxidase 3 n=1 Tax=Sesamum angustifolium TaxID=2727405 RepID=A0AAW2MAP6_9LAMI
MEHGKKYEFGDIQWYPSRHTAVYRYDDRLPINTSGDGVYDFVGFQSNFAIAKSVRASEQSAEAARNADVKCLLASSFLAYKKLTANGLKNNLIFTGYPVIGHQAKMQMSTRPKQPKTRSALGTQESKASSSTKRQPYSPPPASRTSYETSRNCATSTLTASAESTSTTASSSVSSPVRSLLGPAGGLGRRGLQLLSGGRGVDAEAESGHLGRS